MKWRYEWKYKWLDDNNEKIGMAGIYMWWKHNILCTTKTCQTYTIICLPGFGVTEYDINTLGAIQILRNARRGRGASPSVMLPYIVNGGKVLEEGRGGQKLVKKVLRNIWMAP